MNELDLNNDFELTMKRLETGDDGHAFIDSYAWEIIQDKGEINIKDVSNHIIDVLGAIDVINYNKEAVDSFAVSESCKRVKFLMDEQEDGK